MRINVKMEDDPNIRTIMHTSYCISLPTEDIKIHRFTTMKEIRLDIQFYACVLCYAITIHKAQKKTLPFMLTVIDTAEKPRIWTMLNLV